MKLSRLAPFFIIALSLSGTLFFTRNATVWVSLLCTATMLAAVVVLVIYEEASMFFVAVFFINHIAFVEGGRYSNFMFLGALLFMSPIFFYLKKPKRLLPLFLPVFLIAFYYALVLVFKPYALNTAWIVLHFEAVAIFILAQFFSWNTEKIANVSKLHMIALVIFGIFEVTLFYKNRIAGPMMSATAYGVQLVVVWSIWFSYELIKANPRYKSAVVYTVFAIAIMIATGTRMTAIGVVVTLVAIPPLRFIAANRSISHKKILTIGLTAAAAALLIAAVWTLLPRDLLLKRSFETLVQGDVDASSLGRLFAWFCSIQAFQESPLLGIGNGNFMQFIQQNYGSLPLPGFFLTIPHAHNATLVILSENGIAGVTIALTLVGMAFLQTFRHIKQSNTDSSGYCLIIGAAVMCILSMVDAVPYYPSCIVWGAWLLGALVQLPVERKKDMILVKPSIIGA